ncbi:MAG: Fe(3+) ABC transporter substrate-binding protein [Hyphomicrobiales bacterium]
MTKNLKISIAALLAATCASAVNAAEVNIYSYRQPQLIEPILATFTEKTGIKTNVVFAKKGLVERLKAEGQNSPADLILTVDISRLDGAKAGGVTQAVSNETFNTNIPDQYRDEENHWFGLTTRARVVYASKDRVAQNEITYEELADPKWKGKICTRSGQHVYNLGLFASIISNGGEEGAKTWLAGLKDNLTRKPTGNDRAQVNAIYSGECDISLGNTYYMGLMQTNEKKPEQKEWAESVKILFPNSNGRGTHVNISGMALTKHAPNKDAAIELMEWLSGDEAQSLYAEVNFEYPVKPGVEASKRVQSWGSFKADTLSLNDIAGNRDKASELVDVVDYDGDPSS